MGDPNNIDFLTILKFSGLAVGCISGVLGTLASTHEEKTVRSATKGTPAIKQRKITKWGIFSVIMTVVGFLTAGGSQVAENKREKRKEAESRADSKEQRESYSRMEKD